MIFSFGESDTVSAVGDPESVMVNTLQLKAKAAFYTGVLAGR